jgi:hypothetical protein
VARTDLIIDWGSIRGKLNSTNFVALWRGEG